MNKEQFIEYGCPNCRDSLSMQGSEPRVLACTTANYQGFMTLIRPGAFASRFIGLEHRRPGCYALTVKGVIPEHILHESEMERESDMEARGRRSPVPGSVGGASRKDGEDQDSSEDEALLGPGTKADGDLFPEEAPTEEAAARPTPLSPASLDTPVPPSVAAPASAGATSQGSTPKRRRLQLQTGEQNLILEPEGDAEFGGSAP